MKNFFNKLKTIRLNQVFDWMDRKIVYVPALLLSIALAIVSLIFHETNKYWSGATFYFVAAPILYTAFRKARNPIAPFGEIDTVKRMLRTPEERATYRQILGIITLYLFAAGIANAIIGAGMLVLAL